MSMDAALYAPPPKKTKGRGRPRRKGKRLLSPKQLIASNRVPWESHEMLLYGKAVNVLIKTQTCLWYTARGTRLVRMIVTRDPSGRIEDRAYFSTYAEMSPKKIAQFFSLRWPPPNLPQRADTYAHVTPWVSRSSRGAIDPAPPPSPGEVGRGHANRSSRCRV